MSKLNQTLLSHIGEFNKVSPLDYQLVAVSQTDKILGSMLTTTTPENKAVGDYIDRLICVVATAANSSVDLQDGSDTAMSILPAAVGAGVGTYVIEVRAASRVGSWSVTTGSGVTVIAVGFFT